MLYGSKSLPTFFLHIYLYLKQIFVITQTAKQLNGEMCKRNADFKFKP